jgi:radical SAM superfamily enzyme YgiQ (UPF0313 family)
MTKSSPIDVLLLYPFESEEDRVNDPWFRQSVIGGMGAPLFRAAAEFESYLGRSINFSPDSHDQPIFGGQRLDVPAHRSLGAVVLATHLEREGLSWHAIDPGQRNLGYWRRRLEGERACPPRCVALSTTFIASEFWLEALIAIIRRILPSSKLLVGGYFYATNARQFIALDADVCCVGEGEVRLPQIVKALLESRPLDHIPGLFLRQANGILRSTGNAEPLDLNTLPPADWSLADRIEPPIDLERHVLEYEVETQRGCVFKCEFCTYRTLAQLSMMTPEVAAETILRLQTLPRASINIRDATATFPHDRWRRILEILVERGSRFPIWAYARVSDIDEDNVALMRRANVRILFIGQESGDQRMLNLMRKGTRADQVLPAMQRLQRHGIYALMNFIVGFPGENEASLATTRNMIAQLNEQTPTRPASPFYSLTPFVVADFSSVSQRSELRDLPHYFAYDGSEFPIQQVIDATMETFLQASRIPHAPVFGRFLAAVPFGSGISLPLDDRMYDLFHWLKAIERGVAIFVERELVGTRSNEVELERIRRRVLAPMEGREVSRTRVVRTKLQGKGQSFLMGVLASEIAAERARGVGALSRLLMARSSHHVTGSMRAAWRSWRKGALYLGVEPTRRVVPDTSSVESLATELTQRSIEQARVVKLRTGQRSSVDQVSGSAGPKRAEPTERGGKSTNAAAR